ncbi:Chromatin structure-remodeling complex protein SYD [Acorus gramineus]|uniref:Chromatin structure-remodeling complex protein SYD n=1 Tax=Acorus gramineus TaxID=55184 RepID=A0AAV9A9W2_ACOGR|nr:Chromatin structure-remodeling complex protein SYD [Acorus gramineus]
MGEVEGAPVCIDMARDLEELERDRNGGGGDALASSGGVVHGDAGTELRKEGEGDVEMEEAGEDAEVEDEEGEEDEAGSGSDGDSFIDDESDGEGRSDAEDKNLENKTRGFVDQCNNLTDEKKSLESPTLKDEKTSAPVQQKAPLTDAEIEELIAEFLEVESKAAEAQESLEKESLLRVESEVRGELAESLHGDELEIAVSMEMKTFSEEWQRVLNDLETESALLLEQLDGAGVELPTLYKWIESQTPNVCCTETWKKRTQWVGSELTSEITNSIKDAESFLQSCRPVRRQHGRLLEEGASGFLGRKFSTEDNRNAGTENSEKDWRLFNELIQSEKLCENSGAFGTKQWASVYMASTPRQAAIMGLNLPGIDEVEEISEIESNPSDPFYADAIANEKDIDLSEEQRRNFRKVKEEDDVHTTQKLQLQLKRLRERSRIRKEPIESDSAAALTENISRNFSFDEHSKPFSGDVESLKHGEGLRGNNDHNDVSIQNLKLEQAEHIGALNEFDDKKPMVNGTNVMLPTSNSDLSELKRPKRPHDDEDLENDAKRNHTVIIDSDDEVQVVENKSVFGTCSDAKPMLQAMEVVDVDALSLPSPKECDKALGSLEVTSSDSDSELSDVIADAPNRYKKMKKRRIRRILDDAELMEDTKRKIAIEKARQEHLKSLQEQSAIKSRTKNVSINGITTEGANVEMLGDANDGYIVNVVREEDEEPVRIPPSISAKLKPHQVSGIRFMWENIIQSIRKVKSGDKGLGCILAHTMGLGKTFQVIAFLYTAMRVVDLGLKTALIVTPVNVLHNWRHEFEKWKPLELKPLRVFMLEDVARERRAHLLAKWKAKGGVFLIGFQNPIENGQHTNSTSDDVKIMNQRSHILHEQLKGFVQRMDMNVVKKDLPPKTEFVIIVKLSPLQRKLYKRFLDVHGFTNGKISSEKVRRSCFFAAYQALAQIWNHPGLLQMAKEYKDKLRRQEAIENSLIDGSSSDDNVERDVLNGEIYETARGAVNETTVTQKVKDSKKSDGIFFHEEVDWWEELLHEKIYKEVDYSGKMVLLLDILSMSSEMGDKALVFSQSLTTLDLIELYLSRLPQKGREGKCWKQGKDWYRLDGSTEGSERQKIVERFNNPTNKRVKCTLISTRAGSLGINLHAANRVIIIDGSWNPTNDLQAIYRVWREKLHVQVTKEGLAARVVDRQQIHRTMSKEEVLHLFDFGDDENPDVPLPQFQEGTEPSVQNLVVKVVDSLVQKSLPSSSGGSSSDKVMDGLLNRHYSRWIAHYHEHETLLQENEEERLTKEEQDMAWVVFQRSLEWEEVHRVSLDEPDQTSAINHTSRAVTSQTQTKGSSKNRSVYQRKCNNLAHMLTLRSQGIKSGSSTICGDCGMQISWDNLKDGKSR